MKKFKSPINNYFQRYLALVAYFCAASILVIASIRFFVVTPGKVNGTSMEPTYIDEQLFFVDKFSFLLFAPKRFSVVQIIDPSNQKIIIKRIIGLPGEKIVVKRGRVYLIRDGVEEIINESSYLSPNVLTKLPSQTKPFEIQLGADEYFVLGDNRAQSTDSRHYGAVPRQIIIGRVMSIY